MKAGANARLSFIFSDHLTIVEQLNDLEYTGWFQGYSR